MSRDNIPKIALLLAALLLIPNVVFLADPGRSPNFSFLERWTYKTITTQTIPQADYDAHSRNPALSSPVVKWLTNSADPKDIDISFRMKAYTLIQWPNVFQTAPVNSGIRMELAGPSTVVLLTSYMNAGHRDVTSFLVTPHLELNQWHSVHVEFNRQGHITIHWDNVVVVDTVENRIDFDVSQVTIGQGFNATRTFDGAIADFNLQCRSFTTRRYIHFIQRLAWLFNSLLILGPVVLLGLVRYRKPALLQIWAESGYLHVFISVLIAFVSVVAIMKLLQGDAGLLRRYDNVIYASIAIGVIMLIFWFFEIQFSRGFYISLLIPLAIVACGQAFAAAATVIFLLASLGLGLFLQEKFGFGAGDQAGATLIPFFTGMCVNCFLIWISMHLKINYASSYYVFYAFEIFIFRKMLIVKGNAAKKALAEGQLSAGQKAIMLYAVFMVVYSLIHLYDSDDLVAHLYIPKFVHLFGYFPFDPHYPYGLDQAIFPKSAYTSVFLMGGEFAVRFLIYAVFLFGDILLESFTRRQMGERAAFFTVLIMMATPFRIWQSTTAFIDAYAYFPAIVLLVQFIVTLEKPMKKNIFLFFVVCSLAYLCKQQNMFLILPCACCLWMYALYKALKDKDYVFLRHVFLASNVCWMIITPVFIQNYILTKNPLFPYYNALFKSHYFSLDFEVLVRRHMPVWNAWRILYDLAFRGQEDRYYMGDQNSFGILYFIFSVFVPFILILAAKRIRLLTPLLGIFICAVVLWLYVITGPQIRYFISCAPVGALLLGCTMDSFLTLVKRESFLYWGNAALLTVLFGIGFIQQVQIIYIPRYPILEAFKTKPRAISLSAPRDAQYANFFDHINAHMDKNAKALFYYSAALYFADFKVETYDWYNYTTQSDITQASNTRDLFDVLFRKDGFNYLILTDPRPVTKLDPLVAEGWIVAQYSEDGLTLYAPKNPV